MVECPKRSLRRVLLGAENTLVIGFPEELTQMVIGEEEVLDPSYLSDVYSNLLECGFHSCYWEQAFEYIKLIYGFI